MADRARTRSDSSDAAYRRGAGGLATTGSGSRLAGVRHPGQADLAFEVYDLNGAVVSEVDMDQSGQGQFEVAGIGILVDPRNSVHCGTGSWCQVRRRGVRSR